MDSTGNFLNKAPAPDNLPLVNQESTVSESERSINEHKNGDIYIS
jgi:hypothetical protein